MEQLGAHVELQNDASYHYPRMRRDRFQHREAPLDCGNSGSTMRMLAGLLAAQPLTSTLIGDASLSRRPMERIRKPLAAMGARITLTEGHAPVTIHGGPLSGIDYITPMPARR